MIFETRARIHKWAKIACLLERNLFILMTFCSNELVDGSFEMSYIAFCMTSALSVMSVSILVFDNFVSSILSNSYFTA